MTKDFKEVADSFADYLESHQEPLKDFSTRSIHEWIIEHDRELAENEPERTCENCALCEIPDYEFSNPNHIGACSRYCGGDCIGLEWVDYSKSASFCDCEEWVARRR